MDPRASKLAAVRRLPCLTLFHEAIGAIQVRIPAEASEFAAVTNSPSAAALCATGAAIEHGSGTSVADAGSPITSANSRTHQASLNCKNRAPSRLLPSGIAVEPHPIAPPTIFLPSQHCSTHTSRGLTN